MVITGQGKQKDLGLLSLGSDMILHPKYSTKKGKLPKPHTRAARKTRIMSFGKLEDFPDHLNKEQLSKEGINACKHHNF